MRKVLIFAFMLWPALGFGKATSRLRTVVYEKLKVPVNTGNYVDSLVNSEIQQATLDIATITGCLIKTDTIVNGAGVFRRVIGKDSALKIVAVYKRKTYGAISDLVGLTEVTEDKWGQVAPSTPQYTQDHTGDSLILEIQPTPRTAESLWVKYQCYGRRYDTLWTGGGDSMQSLNPENPLPAAFEKLVPSLVGARLLTREAPFRNDVMQMLYQEFVQGASFLPEALIKRVSDLWPLPVSVRELGGANPK